MSYFTIIPLISYSMSMMLFELYIYIHRYSYSTIYSRSNPSLKVPLRRSSSSFCAREEAVWPSPANLGGFRRGTGQQYRLGDDTNPIQGESWQFQNKYLSAYLSPYLYMYIYIYTYVSMGDGQNYLLPAMDMAKVGGPLSVVKVCMCENRVSVSAWSPIGSEGFCTNLTSQVHSLRL